MSEQPDASFDSSNMYSEIIVEFSIINFSCSHDEITKALGVEPSHTWFKGDHVGRKVKYRHRYKNTGWLLESGLPRDTPARDQLRALLDRLHPRRESLKACGPYYARFTCVVYSYNGHRPDLVFPPEDVRRMADLSAGIAIDLYVL
jgi:hypothetical protein